MAFTVVATNNVIQASHITEIQDALQGVSGGGQAIAMTQYNASGTYALDVRNLDGTNSYGLRVRDASSNTLLSCYKNNIVIGAAVANDTLTLNAALAGTMYIGDTANSFMGVGITINEGTNNSEVLTFKAAASKVTHGMSLVTETDTYGAFKRLADTSGGLLMYGFTEATIGLELIGAGVTDDATKSTAGLGYVAIIAAKKSDTTVAAPTTASTNLMTIGDYGGGTRFTFDLEGDSHEDGTGWTAYDDHDDVALLDLVNSTFLRASDPIKQEFWTWVGENARQLEDLKLITFNDDGHHFINRSKMQELTVGAIRQLGRKLDRYEKALLGLGVSPALLTEGA